MIRGTIEQASRELVSGWLYSDETVVRGRMILAFLDDVCVGAGRIEAHRPDLEAAGLGDGYLGFAFPISVPAASDIGRVTVKLEGSDAVFIERGAKVVWPETEFSGPMTKAKADALIASYKWMLSRGWLKQSDYDYLKALTQFGIYERTLVAGSSSGEMQLVDVRQLSTDLLSLLHQTAVEPTEQRPASAEAFSSLLEELRERPGRSGLGLWCSERSTMNVLEGSHLGDVDPASARAAAVRFPLDPERLVILDAHCRVEFGEDFPVGGLRVFVTGGATGGLGE